MLSGIEKQQGCEIVKEYIPMPRMMDVTGKLVVAMPREDRFNLKKVSQDRAVEGIKKIMVVMSVSLRCDF